MHQRSLQDGEESFEVTLLESEHAVRTVLFAVGAGGNPQRHQPLLEALASEHCTVIAPHFERIVSPLPTQASLLLRARRLRLALEAFSPDGVAVAGVGHSIGAMLLISLAGGQAWMGPGNPIVIATDARIDRLALLCPPTGFFQAPQALNAVRTPIVAWVGSADTVTPPADVMLLRNAPNTSVDLHIVQGAGHFSFMNILPPHIVDPLADRDTFLARLAKELHSFCELSPDKC
jgi:pimeloyl-ACP methyl ester carboxylesterase